MEKHLVNIESTEQLQYCFSVSITGPNGCGISVYTDIWCKLDSEGEGGTTPHNLATVATNWVDGTICDLSMSRAGVVTANEEEPSRLSCLPGARGMDDKDLWTLAFQGMPLFDPSLRLDKDIQAVEVVSFNL